MGSAQPSKAWMGTVKERAFIIKECVRRGWHGDNIKSWNVTFHRCYFRANLGRRRLCFRSAYPKKIQTRPIRCHPFPFICTQLFLHVVVFLAGWWIVFCRSVARGLSCDIITTTPRCYWLDGGWFWIRNKFLYSSHLTRRMRRPVMKNGTVSRPRFRDRFADTSLL